MSSQIKQPERRHEFYIKRTMWSRVSVLLLGFVTVCFVGCTASLHSDADKVSGSRKAKAVSLMQSVQRSGPFGLVKGSTLKDPGIKDADGEMRSLNQPLESGLKPTQFVPSEPEQWDLKNGVKVFFARDEQSPLITASLTIAGGSLTDTADSWGVSGMMGSLLSAGGTASYLPDELDKFLEQRSIGIKSGVGLEYGSISLSCLAQQIGEALPVYKEVIFRPRFDDQRLRLAQLKSLEGIKRRKDEASSIAVIAGEELIYGDSPFGRISTSASVMRITREALLKRYQGWLRSTGAIFTISGPISSEDAKEIVSDLFEGWNAGSGLQASRGPSDEAVKTDQDGPLPTLPEPQSVGIYFVPANFDQAFVLVMQRGLSRHTEDQYRVDAFNELLGGGGSSRVYREVRTRRGLAYDTGGGMSTGLVRGKNILYAQTKNETAGEAVEALIGTLNGLKKEVVSEDELGDHLRSIVNSFIFANETPRKVMERKASLRLLGFPDDYDRSYTERIRGIVGSELPAFVERSWPNDKWLVVVVGKGAALKSVEASQAKLPKVLQRPVVVGGFGEKLELR